MNGDDELFDLIKDPTVFKFSIIRDPRARVFSAYKNKFVDAPPDVRNVFLAQLGKESQNYLDSSGILSFDGFLKLVSKQTPLQMNEHWKPMAYQLLGLGPEKVNLFDLSEISLALRKVDAFVERKNSFESPDLKFSPHATNSSAMSLHLNADMVDMISSIYACDLYLYLYKKSFSEL